MRNIILSALLLTTAATPAFADPVSGFYAGVYGGGGTHSQGNYELEAYIGMTGIAGSELDGITDNSTALPNEKLEDFIEWLEDEADGDDEDGVALWGAMEGIVDLMAAPSFGAVLGYGFGNGLRIEADLSRTSHAAASITIDGGAYQYAIGENVEGNWQWDVFQDGDTDEAFASLIDMGDTGVTYTSSAQFILASAYYDIDTGTAFTPYLGAGLGVAHVTGTLSNPYEDMMSASAMVPAGQLGAGVRMDVSGPVTLDLGYRLRVAGDPALSMWGGDSIQYIELDQSGPIVMHGVQVGMTIAFD